MKKRYVWLNLDTGEFTNSWDDFTLERVKETPQSLLITLESHANKDRIKLIEYTCHNDENFEFYNKMKLR